MLSLYNTLTKTQEPFIPLNPGKVGMYTCGPTVYGFIHIGNIRAYLMADTLRRLLEYSGYEVRAIKNITDVGHLTDDDIAQGDSGEDKIEKKARAEKKTPEEIARFYEDYFRETEAQMNILPAHYFPRATAHIPQMIRLIETLIARGHAYEVHGNVFLDVTTFPEYGALSGNTLDKLKVGARLEEHPDKRHPWDFALWLRAPENHLMKWPSPWSVGYPGWHIECSAMSTEYLGDTLDIHTGGEDNIFPHHEAEIVQTEGVTDKPFVRYWVHLRHLLVDGVKMSKSKGNLYILEDILKRGYSAMDLRFFLLLSHYRSQMNFTWESLVQAHANRESLQHFYDRLEDYTATAVDDSVSLDTEQYKKDFLAALEDDINTPQAITVLLDMIKTGNTLMNIQKLANPIETVKLLDVFTSLLGLHRTHYVSAKISGTSTTTTTATIVPQDIIILTQERDRARAEKNFTRADELRDKIEKAGFTLKDTPQGTQIRKK